MVRRLVGLAVFAALAGCAIGGPAQREIELAVAEYYELPLPVEIIDPRGLRDARITLVGACTIAGASHVCPVEFERSDGARVFADIWLAPGYRSGWTASGVVPRESQ
jgi:hypothetical protein